MEHEDNWTLLHSLNYNTWNEEDYRKLEDDGQQTIFPDLADEVNKPSHYRNGSIECIDYLKDNLPPEVFHGYLEGNIKKYLHRWRYKQKPVQDLEKAKWYLERLIKELK